MRKTALAVLLAALSLTLAACGGAPTATAPAAPAPTPPPAAEATAEPVMATAPVAQSVAADLPAGWKPLTIEADGRTLSLGLPPDWEQIDTDATRFDASISALRDQNPGLASFLEGQARTLVQSGVKFFGFDRDPAPTEVGFATNINILVQPLGSAGVALDEFTQANLSQLNTLPSVILPASSERVTLGDIPADKVRYGLALSRPDGTPLTIATTQYYLIVDDRAYVVTFSTTDDQIDGYLPTFEQMAQTLRVS